LRLKGRLLFTPGVMVASVPWQLHSSKVGHAPLGAGPPDGHASVDVPGASPGPGPDGAP
jgi:hypothetical protein